MTFINNCLIGFFIGIGAILPGISSGVICVVFGIYEKLLNSILGFFKNIKENLKFLFPIILGIIIGIFIFSNIINYLFYSFPIQTKSIFIGLILGIVPNLVINLNRKEKINFKHIIILAFSIIIGIASIFIEKNFPDNFTNSFNNLYLFICGFLMSIGVVVPGISSTVILMLLGIYPLYLESVSHINLHFLFPMGLGLLFRWIYFYEIN